MILDSGELRGVRDRIALDIGNVLVHVDIDIFIDELFLMGIDKFRGLEFLVIMQNFFDNGILDMEKALQLRFPELSKKERDRACEAWLAVVKPCFPTLEVVTELLSEGASVALLSNIGRDHADYLSDMCSGQFDRCIKHFSCDVGARKPTKLFYQSFTMDYPEFSQKKLYSKGRLTYSKMSRGLFLDDRLENIDAARMYLDAKIFDISKYASEEDAAKDMVRIIQDI